MDDDRHAQPYAVKQKIGNNLETVIRDIYSDQHKKQLSLIVTGELSNAIKITESLRNRCVTIHLASDSDLKCLRKEQITACYRDPLLIPTCIHYFFRYWSKYADKDTLENLYESSFSDCSSIEKSDEDERLYDNITMIFFAFKTFIYYAQNCELICPARGDEFLYELTRGLASLYEANLEFFGLGYEELFLKLLLASIQDGSCKIQACWDNPGEDYWNTPNTDILLQANAYGLYIPSTYGLDTPCMERSIIIFETTLIFECVNRHLDEYCRKERRSISHFTSQKILHLLGDRNIVGKETRTKAGKRSFNYQFEFKTLHNDKPGDSQGFILNRTPETGKIFAAAAEKGSNPYQDYSDRYTPSLEYLNSFRAHIRTKR